VMSEPGKAMMGTATATGPDRARKAAEQAVACPLLEGIDLSGARGVLVLIAASQQSYKLAESKAVMSTIRMYADKEAHVIFGAAFDDSLGDQLRVTVIATGLSSNARRQQTPELQVVNGTTGRSPMQTQPQAQTVVRTGTDNYPLLQDQVRVPTSPADFQSLNTPSVWRSARAKVETLSNSGMDEIEIPAFLRKQAD
jgi:cell division protein FtsZ